MCRHRKYRINPNIPPTDVTFHYDNVVARGMVRANGYRCTALVPEHLSLIREDLQNSDALSERGWKIHISLEDTDVGNIQRAWDCLADVFVEEKISLVKLIRPGSGTLDMDVHRNNWGRQITIYSHLDLFSPEQWQRTLQKINDILVENNISPGRRSAVCRPISGSSYFSYRHDGTSEYYISARGASSYNPLMARDTYATIAIVESSKCCCTLM